MSESPSGWEPFRDRRDAGRRLAAVLGAYRGPDTVVLGVPRGGVAVAAEVAAGLGASLDVVLAHKLGAPWQAELAIGAVTSEGDLRLLDEPALHALGVSAEYVEAETVRQRADMSRRLTAYRGERPPPELAGKTVIVVDDGVATGYTMRAALAGLRRLNPARLVAAVPVAPPSACAALAEVADEVVCLLTPAAFGAVGAWYRDFDQVDDETVHLLLHSGQRERFPAPDAL